MVGIFCVIWRAAMVAVFVLLYLISKCLVSGKIHRVHPHFHANFTIIDGRRRLTANCVRNTTVQRLHDCVGECVRDKRCATFNYHRYEGFCELLTLSKFDVEGILEHDDNWVHYETDDNESLYGPVCLATSPCKSYQVCEDTYECCTRKYICKCREGYSGKNCDVYKGYGSTKERSAPSCDLLLERFHKLPNGRYWIKTVRSTEKKYCERYANGGFAPWAPFTPCSVTCGGGQQIRRRACKHPSPTFNGPQCIGEAEYSKACNQHACPIDGGWGGWTSTACSLTCGSGTLTKTRSCDTPTPSNGGVECLKSDGMTRDVVENITAACETQHCPACTGKKTNRRWNLRPSFKRKKTSEEECIALCLDYNCFGITYWPRYRECQFAKPGAKMVYDPISLSYNCKTTL